MILTQLSWKTFSYLEESLIILRVDQKIRRLIKLCSFQLLYQKKKKKHFKTYLVQYFQTKNQIPNLKQYKIFRRSPNQKEKFVFGLIVKMYKISFTFEIYYFVCNDSCSCLLSFLIILFFLAPIKFNICSNKGPSTVPCDTLLLTTFN